MTYFMAYTGYQPGGEPAPDLYQVPIPPEPYGQCTFILAFAKDMNYDGNFVPQWDTTNLTPEYLAGIVAGNPSIQFYASLGGANGYWQPVTDQQAQQQWVSNAVSSITSIVSDYGLAGVDIDFEFGPDTVTPLDQLGDPSFVQVMSQVVLQSGLIGWSIAPFGSLVNLEQNSTLNTYLDLYDTVSQQDADAIQIINYQAYANETTDQVNYYDNYVAIGNDSRITSHGFVSKALGIDTNTVQQRGMQYPYITNFCQEQMDAQSGLFNRAVIWSIEDSIKNGFPVETALING
jgi:Glycosyl hydrolases family 18